MDLQLRGKTAIVTGGSAGIGLAIARLLAEEGVEVTIPSRNGKKLKEAIASLPVAVRGVEADLATADGARTLIERVPETDILVNNTDPRKFMHGGGGPPEESLWRGILTDQVGTTHGRCRNFPGCV